MWLVAKKAECRLEWQKLDKEQGGKFSQVKVNWGVLARYESVHVHYSDAMYKRCASSANH
jgi:hypothetical protein